MENIISPILPKTPTKSFSFTSSCIPNPTDHLQVSFPLRLQYHTTSNLCSEGGLVKYHKGIVPNHPKGYYCCLNTELASRQSNLRVVDNSVLLEVYGPIGLLAYIEAVDSAIIRQEVASLENLGLTVILCVDNFMESGKCTTTTQRQLYQFSDDSWNARVCVYTRPTPPMDLSSYGFASASAMASGAYKNDNVEVSMKEDNAGQSVVRPRPLKRSLFHTQSSKESNNLFKRGGNDNDGDDRKKHLKTETMMTCSSSIINSRGALEPRSLFTRNKKKLVAI